MNSLISTTSIFTDSPFKREGITLEGFELFLSLKQGQTKWTTICHVGRLKRFLYWLNGRDITPSIVEEYFYFLKQKKYTSSTLNSYLSFFRLFEKYLTNKGEPLNFIDGFKAQKVEKPYIEILSPEEIKKLIETPVLLQKKTKNPQFSSDKLDKVYRDVIAFLALTGCRFSECTEMRCKQVDLENRKVTFLHTKSKKNRKAYLAEQLVEILKKRVSGKEREDLVFTNCLGGKIHGPDFINSLHTRAKQIGITKRVYPHLFRHSFATQLLQDGVDVTMVSEILGHSDIKITYDNYAHLADESLKEATFRHILIRQSAKPSEILSQISEKLQSFNLKDDPRFTYEIIESSSGLQVKILVAQSVM